MQKLLFVFMGFFLTACTQAGPFVTNISRAKNGDLLIEKCMIKHNAFMGTVSNENCTSQKI